MKIFRFCFTILFCAFVSTVSFSQASTTTIIGIKGSIRCEPICVESNAGTVAIQYDDLSRDLSISVSELSDPEILFSRVFIANFNRGGRFINLQNSFSEERSPYVFPLDRYRLSSGNYRLVMKVANSTQAVEFNFYID